MIDINMKVQPSFYDDECAIVFSFYFDEATRKIGEAVVYTCEESKEEECNQDHIDTDVQGKIAYIKEFSIVDEYQATSMKKIQHFLSVIGIKKCVKHSLKGTEIAF
ncbi:hypothetical protein [Peribacillus sp. SI8-4]|uniref:hypothetical protein n=1 Tax=Peribacillus sp. SI8-4 TaxID=3048009 RepID=UPI0025535B40|nr:hypothetical protein [Peribacillus sp. SI8-4]